MNPDRAYRSGHMGHFSGHGAIFHNFRYHVTKPLGWKQKSRLRCTLQRVPRTQNIETSNRFPSKGPKVSKYWNVNSLSLTLSEPIDLARGHILKTFKPHDLDLDLDCGKKCITHRPLHTPSLIKLRRKVWTYGKTDIMFGSGDYLKRGI